MGKDKQYAEVPGNVLATQAEIERTLAATGSSVHMLDHLVAALFDEGVQIKAIRLKLPEAKYGEVMAVVTMEAEGVGYVGFHVDTSVANTLRGVSSRLKNRSFKWKEDEYAR